MTYGTSLGSLIAQSLGIHHPECVDRLVLAAALRLRDIAPETARRFKELRADRVKDAEQIARIFHPEPHLAAHHEAMELFKSQRRTPRQQQRRGPARADATPRFVPDHGAGARWPRGSLDPVRSWVVDCRRNPGGTDVNPGGRRARQCDPSPCKGSPGDLWLLASGMKSVN